MFFLVLFLYRSGDSSRDKINDDKRNCRTDGGKATEGKSMARKMINWMSRGTSSVPICRSGFVVCEAPKAAVVGNDPSSRWSSMTILVLRRLIQSSFLAYPARFASTHVVKTLTRLLSPLVVSRLQDDS